MVGESLKSTGSVLALLRRSQSGQASCSMPVRVTVSRQRLSTYGKQLSGIHGKRLSDGSLGGKRRDGGLLRERHTESAGQWTGRDAGQSAGGEGSPGRRCVGVRGHDEIPRL